MKSCSVDYLTKSSKTIEENATKIGLTPQSLSSLMYLTNQFNCSNLSYSVSDNSRFSIQ